MKPPVSTPLPAWRQSVETVLGSPGEPMSELEERASRLLSSMNPIVWEADPSTLDYTYISQKAADILGYPIEQWTSEPGFWSSVVYEEDRNATLANTALCTGSGKDTEFDCRIVASDGRILKFHAVLKPFKGPYGVARRLRGILLNPDLDEPRSSDNFA